MGVFWCLSVWFTNGNLCNKSEHLFCFCNCIMLPLLRFIYVYGATSAVRAVNRRTFDSTEEEEIFVRYFMFFRT